MCPGLAVPLYWPVGIKSGPCADVAVPVVPDTPPRCPQKSVSMLSGPLSFRVPRPSQLPSASSASPCDTVSNDGAPHYSLTSADNQLTLGYRGSVPVEVPYHTHNARWRGRCTPRGDSETGHTGRYSQCHMARPWPLGPERKDPRTCSHLMQRDRTQGGRGGSVAS